MRIKVVGAAANRQRRKTHARQQSACFVNYSDRHVASRCATVSSIDSDNVNVLFLRKYVSRRRRHCCRHCHYYPAVYVS